MPLVDTDGEPVSGSLHVLVFLPEESIGSRCVAVSRASAPEGGSPMGFYGIDWAKLKASYDASRGLLLILPCSTYDGTGGRPASDLRIRVDLKGEGSVRLE